MPDQDFLSAAVQDIPKPLDLKPALDKPATFLGQAVLGLEDNPNVPAQSRYDLAVERQARSGVPFDQAAAELKAKFGVDPAAVKGDFELRRAHHEYSQKTPSFAEYALLRSVPFVSSIGTFGMAREYKAAKDRYAAGSPEPGDAKTIARYERLQDLDKAQYETAGGAIRGSLAHLPAIIGEAYLTGGVANEVKAASSLKAAKPALAAEATAAGTAEEGGLLEAAGLRSIAPRAGAPTAAKQVAVWGAKNAAQTAAMPSMYLPQSAENAIHRGGDWSDVDNLGRAYAIGYMQTAILGSLGPVGNAIPGKGPVPFVARLGTRTATGMLEQQAADAVAGSTGLQTHYGLVGDILTGKEGTQKEATVQAITFAAFSLMHELPQRAPRGRAGEPTGARPPELPRPELAAKLEPFISMNNELKARGFSGEESGQVALDLSDRIQAALQKNPSLTADEAKALFANEKNPAVRAYGEHLADAMLAKHPLPVDASLPPEAAAPAPAPAAPAPAPAAPAAPPVDPHLARFDAMKPEERASLVKQFGKGLSEKGFRNKLAGDPTLQAVVAAAAGEKVELGRPAATADADAYAAAAERVKDFLAKNPEASARQLDDLIRGESPAVVSKARDLIDELLDAQMAAPKKAKDVVVDPRLQDVADRLAGETSHNALQPYEVSKKLFPGHAGPMLSFDVTVNAGTPAARKGETTVTLRTMPSGRVDIGYNPRGGGVAAQGDAPGKHMPGAEKIAIFKNLKPIVEGMAAKGIPVEYTTMDGGERHAANKALLRRAGYEQVGPAEGVKNADGSTTYQYDPAAAKPAPEFVSNADIGDVLARHQHDIHASRVEIDNLVKDRVAKGFTVRHWYEGKAKEVTYVPPTRPVGSNELPETGFFREANGNRIGLIASITATPGGGKSGIEFVPPAVSTRTVDAKASVKPSKPGPSPEEQKRAAVEKVAEKAAAETRANLAAVLKDAGVTNKQFADLLGFMSGEDWKVVGGNRKVSGTAAKNSVVSALGKLDPENNRDVGRLLEIALGANAPEVMRSIREAERLDAEKARAATQGEAVASEMTASPDVRRRYAGEQLALDREFTRAGKLIDRLESEEITNDELNAELLRIAGQAAAKPAERGRPGPARPLPAPPAGGDQGPGGRPAGEAGAAGGALGGRPEPAANAPGGPGEAAGGGARGLAAAIAGAPPEVAAVHGRMMDEFAATLADVDTVRRAKGAAAADAFQAREVEAMQSIVDQWSAVMRGHGYDPDALLAADPAYRVLSKRPGPAAPAAESPKLPPKPAPEVLERRPGETAQAWAFRVMPDEPLAGESYADFQIRRKAYFRAAAKADADLKLAQAEYAKLKKKLDKLHPNQGVIDAIKEAGGIKFDPKGRHFDGKTKAAMVRQNDAWDIEGVLHGKPREPGERQRGLGFDEMAGHLAARKIIASDVVADLTGPKGAVHGEHGDASDKLLSAIEGKERTQFRGEAYAADEHALSQLEEFIDNAEDPSRLYDHVIAEGHKATEGDAVPGDADESTLPPERPDAAAPPGSEDIPFAPPGVPVNSPPAAPSAAGRLVGQHDIVRSIDAALDMHSYRDTPPGGQGSDAAYYTRHMAAIVGNFAQGNAQKRVHEAAHHVEQVYKLPVDPAALGPQITAGFRQFDYFPGRANQRLAVREGFAEWMRRWATDDLANLTPEQGAAAFFAESFVASKPGLYKKLAAIRQQFRDFAAQTPVRKAAGELSAKGAPPDPERSPAALAAAKLRSVADAFQDAVDNDLAVLKRMKAERKRQGLPDLPADKDPELVWSQTRFQHGATAAQFEQNGYMRIVNGKRVFSSKGLDHVLQPWAKEDLAPFRPADASIAARVRGLFERPDSTSRAAVFLVANHVLDEVSRGRRPVAQEQIDLFRDAMAEMTLDQPFVQRAAEAARRYTEAGMNDGLRMLASPEIHRLTPDLVDTLIRERPTYVPLTRVREDATWSALGGRSKGEFMPNPVKARTGSGEQILDPFASLRLKYMERASQVDEQLRRNAVMEMVLGGGLGKYALPGDPKQVSDKAGNVYDTFEPWPADGSKPSFWWAGPGGKMTNVRVGDRSLYDLLTNQQVESNQAAKLARAFSSLSVAVGGLQVKPVEVVNKVLRFGATGASLAFQLKNLPRDVYTFFSNTQSPLSVFSLPKAYGQVYLYESARLLGLVTGKDHADPVTRLFAEGRGGQLRQYAFDESRPASAYDKARGGPIQSARNLLDVAKQFMNVVGAGELGPRYQEFKNELGKRGWTEAALRAELKKADAERDAGRPYVEPVPIGDLFAALDAASEVTTPFARQGVLTRELNKITPFFGPSVAGLSKSLRNWKTNPKGAVMALGVAMGLRLLYWATYHDEDWYGELSDYDRHNNFVVPVPGLGLRRLPGFRGPEVGTGAMLTTLLDASVGKNPRLAGAVEQSLTANLPPGVDRPAGSLVRGDYAGAAAETVAAPFGPAGQTILDLGRNKDFTGKPIVPERDLDLPMREKVAGGYGPYAVKQLTGGRGEASPRGLGLEPFPEVKPRETVNKFYDRLKEVEAERELAKKRSEPFADEARYDRMKRIEARMTVLNGELRGERKVGNRTVSIPVPDERRKDAIRAEQLRLARLALE